MGSLEGYLERLIDAFDIYCNDQWRNRLKQTRKEVRAMTWIPLLNFT